MSNIEHSNDFCAQYKYSLFQFWFDKFKFKLWAIITSLMKLQLDLDIATLTPCVCMNYTPKRNIAYLSQDRI